MPTPQARVRPGDRPDHDATTGCSPGIDREQPVWMSHGDSITRLPGGLPRDGADRLDALRRPRRPGPEPVRDPVPPRGRPHAARQGRPAQLRHRHRAASRPAWTPANFIDSTVAEIRERVDAPRARDRLRRQGHLRAVGRRRLGGRGGPRPSRRRRSADLHLRRPRADAQEGVGAPAGDVRGEPRHAAWSWSTPASGSSPGSPASPTRSRSGGSSATSSSGCSRRRRPRSGGSTS